VAKPILFYDRYPQFVQSYEVDAIDYLLNLLNLNVFMKQYKSENSSEPEAKAIQKSLYMF
jgi:hypothetical protein